MKELKVFVSQPMKDRSVAEITEERNRIFYNFAQNHPDESVREIPSYDPCLPKMGNSLYCLGWSLQMLAQADVAVFARDWRSARGCEMEHRACLMYGIPIEYDGVEQ